VDLHAARAKVMELLEVQQEDQSTEGKEEL
jgi:hypothetical protein